jgi:hypothetical protein
MLARLFARATVVLAIGFVLFASTASAYTLYRCGADGRTHSACCCPGADAREDDASDRETRVERGCCCDIETHNVAHANGLERRSSDSDALALVPSHTIDLRTPARASADHSLRRDHLAIGPPLVLQKRSFLL